MGKLPVLSIVAWQNWNEGGLGMRVVWEQGWSGNEGGLGMRMVGNEGGLGMRMVGNGVVWE